MSIVLLTIWNGDYTNLSNQIKKQHDLTGHCFFFKKLHQIEWVIICENDYPIPENARRILHVPNDTSDLPYERLSLWFLTLKQPCDVIFMHPDFYYHPCYLKRLIQKLDSSDVAGYCDEWWAKEVCSLERTGVSSRAWKTLATGVYVDDLAKHLWKNGGACLLPLA